MRKKSSGDNRDIRIGEPEPWIDHVDNFGPDADVRGDGYFFFVAVASLVVAFHATLC